MEELNYKIVEVLNFINKLTEKDYKKLRKDDLNYLINTLYEYTSGNSEHVKDVKEVKEAMDKLKKFYKKREQKSKKSQSQIPLHKTN